ncbi:MAG: L-seryl-tRNA(Sec) selenium transferase [Planctomycetes bacterium]|nr:L-seryl-tRNA(Sec) selenium transferase [Planctomycetota bacterium]
MSNNPNAALRNLPSITTLLEHPTLREAAEQYGQVAVTSAVRSAVDHLRSDLQTGEQAIAQIPPPQQLADQIAKTLLQQDASGIRPVINATGILLHTGLGRAPLAKEAAEAAEQAARGYCNVELDLASGQRTQRSKVVERLLCELTGAEAAHVVNNNAGATGLILATLATGREVIVSHGELIEIGGGFRVPEVISAYGAILRTVGTTNRTRVDDYANAIGEQTGALLVVHPSNYHITGFTEHADLQELAALAREQKVPLVHDIGSGALIDFRQFGCADEPIASASIKAGVDLVFFSGDKLLGGPQCGIIVGQRDLIEQVTRHPLSRALRVDKITLAALHATLKLYRTPEKARQAIPLLRFLSTPQEDLKNRTDRLAEQLRTKLEGWEVQSEPDEAFVGGGSLPQQGVPSYSLVLTSAEHCVEALAGRLRAGEPAVVGRVQQGRLVLNLHGLFEEQDELLSQAVVAATAE